MVKHFTLIQIVCRCQHQHFLLICIVHHLHETSTGRVAQSSEHSTTDPEIISSFVSKYGIVIDHLIGTLNIENVKNN